MTSEHSDPPEGLEATPFEPFSNGYWAAVLDIQPFDEGPVIEQSLYDYIEANLYQQTDAPPWVRFGMDGESPYFELEPEPGVPAQVVGVPQKLIEKFDLETHGQGCFVMLVRPSHAYMFAQQKVLEEQVRDFSLNL